jgi:hypothetical protein
MQKNLRYSLVFLMAMVMGTAFGQEVTLDFTLADANDSKVSAWGFPAGSANKLVEEQSFTYGGYTVKVAGSAGYYWHDKDHYLLFGKQGATVTLPAFSFDVERIDVEGNSGASAKTVQNIYVGEEAVSTETEGVTGVNVYNIAAGKQAAGTIYVIKVNSAHNDQIKTIKVWKKGTAQEVTVPVADNIAAFTALGNGTEAELKLDGAKVTYVSPDSKSVYVRDATGGMCFYSQDAFAEATNKWVLGGSLKGKVSIRNNMTQMNITDAAALTHTEGAEYAPVAVTMAELKDHVGDLVKLTEDFTATDVSGKFYNNEAKDVQLYDNFKLGYTVNAGDVLKNLTGVVIMYNTQVELAPTVAPSTDGGADEPILTLKGKVGEEVSLTFGVYETEDTYSVDFGDGNLQTNKVGINNAGPVQEDGTTTTATVFKGTVAGDGTVKVYGKNDIWYFLVSGDAMPTTFDQAKLMNVVQMSITGANAESVALPAYEKLTQFSFNNSPVKKVDVSKVTTLTRIDIYNTTQSAYEPQLETIDLSKNVDLETIVLGGNSYKKGVLKALDLTNNTKLTQISAENNKITTVTGIPVSVKNIYLSNNELASLTFPELTSKGTIQIQNNKFTLATLPTKPAITSTSKYTYAPQPAYQVDEMLEVLDLSSQLTATGILTEPATTTYSFVTASGTALVEGTDYEVTAPGKFKFLKGQDEKVHGVMATTAFPKFSGANAYVTTDFAIGKSNSATFDFENNNGNWPIGEGADYAKGELKEDNPITKSGVTLTGIQGSATTAVRYATNASKGNCLWIFKNNAIKLSAPEGMDIVKVEVTMQTGSFDLAPSTGEVADNVWTGKASEVTFGPNAKGTRYVYAIKVTLEENASAIKSIQTQKGNGKIYNLQGVEVAQPVKGLYIQNGKKVIVK